MAREEKIDITKDEVDDAMVYQTFPTEMNKMKRTENEIEMLTQKEIVFLLGGTE